jgi:enediyne biosynthesis protein E3
MTSVSVENYSTIMKKLRTLIFGLSLDEATFERRGFPECGAKARERLERVGKTFLTGYLAALDNANESRLTRALEAVELETRGFAYEGAAMALGLLDILFPWRRDRWRSFTNGPALRHVYMMNVGLGWALARLKRSPERYLERLDPLIGWLVMDGYGFHDCYFGWRKVMVDHHVPDRVRGYARNVFDQGVGRALWFVNGADPRRIAEIIGRFPADRHSDLWSGVGLAAAYAGGVDESALALLALLCGDHRAAMAQGVLFATETRMNAGNLATHTTLACRVICGINAEDGCEIVNEARKSLPYNEGLPAYEIWRRRIQAHFLPGGKYRPEPMSVERLEEYHHRRISNG